MSVAAAIRIESEEDLAIVARAAEFAERTGDACYVISIVPSMPAGGVVERNLERIAEHHATPVMQEGGAVADALVSAARWFGVRTLFVQNGRRRLFRRSIAERLLALAPPFEIVVVQREQSVTQR